MEARQQLIDSLGRDLMGPQGPADEVIQSRPSDQYLTGILFPLSNRIDQGEEAARQENDDSEDLADGVDGSPGESISMQSIRRPNSLGLSFGIIAEGDPSVVVHATLGSYLRYVLKESELVRVDSLADEDRVAERWRRTPITIVRELPVTDSLKSFAESSAPGLTWYIRGHRLAQSEWLVTVVLCNENKPQSGRIPQEEASYFQSGFKVSITNATFSGRRPRPSGVDEDGRISNLIYRDVKEWAVGHTCAATWDDSPPRAVETCWIPTQAVLSVSADGDPLFEAHARQLGSGTDPFDAAMLASEPSADRLRELLSVVPDAYSAWLAKTRNRLSELRAASLLDAEQLEIAEINLERGVQVCSRIREGIALIFENQTVRLAFQLSQRAMVVQRQWTQGKPDSTLRWRPFQLGFFLQTLCGLAAPTRQDGTPTEDRSTMDLLWFPTGGGKTEAYLALTAFAIIHRRLIHGDQPDLGAGVAVLMRYTLRLLTVQQFERAARLILACEAIRQGSERELGATPFSIGLWVGGDATPNRVDETVDLEKDKKARQLAACPACLQETLQWNKTQTDHFVVCKNQTCPFFDQRLPIATIDEMVYRLRPSLLIGTVDKFTQIVRKSDSGNFFSPEAQSPDLIIQDELHLISGPLGTLAGLYETAIDALCTKHGIPPKIVGSTATIRRAREQVRALFARRVSQFPPPVLDSDNSGFAVVEPGRPGRIYVGFTSAGRSPKFLLQACTASLLQGTSELQESEKDPYWTLVAYFNSLRELGGALVMMYDDVPQSVRLYSTSHATPPRNPEVIDELTSRISSADIPPILKGLAVNYPNQLTDVVLATNMLSVGVDVPRLGLMVVNGQPKSMSEYIQATSRVGRNAVAGLVVTCYNAGRPRDRSHFESFRTWHQALYREVEATSVTPFAPRARDRALHAPLVAIARHRLSGLGQAPRPVTDSMLESVIERIVARVVSVDPDVAADAAAELRDFCRRWTGRQSGLKTYWNDYQSDTSLLVSSERAATVRAQRGAWTAAATPTPNSLRDVEATVTCTLRPKPSGAQ